MLKTLILRNFQVHRKLKIELDDRVTILTGSSDTGKSSIIRALYWLAFNRPSGDQFISHNKDSVRVSLEVDEHWVSRSKGKKDNRYKLDEEVFAAFGSEVPEEVRRVLNLGQDNFQLQLAPLYLLARTPGEAARDLNQVVNLQLIDKTLAKFTSALRTAKITVDVSVDRLSKAELRLEGLKWAVQADRELQRLERLDEDISTLRFRTAQNRLYREEIKRIDSALVLARRRATCGSVALTAGQRLYEAVQRLTQIQSYSKQLTRLKEQLWQIQTELKRVEKELAKIKTCPICDRPLS